MSQMKLTGHRVLVTGGSSGIGLALAKAFLARGNQVTVCGRNAEALERAAQEAPGLLTTRCDVSDEGDLIEMVEWSEANMGGLSVLVNNAGIQLNYDFAQTQAGTAVRHIDSEIGTNLAGLMKASALFLPLLMQNEEAAIVNVSSGLALVPKKSAPVYCATKAAVHSFSKSLRWQLEDAGARVRVFEVLPPLVDTPMTAGRGAGKVSPGEVAQAVLRGMERDRWEMRVGKSHTLGLINRLFPPISERIMRNS